MFELSFVCHSNARLLCVIYKAIMVNFWWFENWILSPFTRQVRVVKGRAIKIVLHVTHMSVCTAVNARKKIDWQNPPAKYTWKCPPLPHHQTVPCHFTFNATDWMTLFACRHVKQKPDSYVSTYFKFFPAINRNFFFFHFSLLVYLKISRQFCLLFYMLNENEIITFFVYDWWGF